MYTFCMCVRFLGSNVMFFINRATVHYSGFSLPYFVFFTCLVFIKHCLFLLLVTCVKLFHSITHCVHSSSALKFIACTLNAYRYPSQLFYKPNSVNRLKISQFLIHTYLWIHIVDRYQDNKPTSHNNFYRTCTHVTPSFNYFSNAN